MRKAIIILTVLFVLICCASCTAADRKAWSQNFTYKDPQTIGGKWTLVTQNGEAFEHTTCEYWGTDDDTSVWTLQDGKTLIQSGACYAIREDKK